MTDDDLPREFDTLKRMPVPRRLDPAALAVAGRHRMWRQRAVGGSAACGLLLAAGLLVPALTTNSDDGRPTEPRRDGTAKSCPPGTDEFGAYPGDFAERELTYSVGSTIHYGDREIDVAPYQIEQFAQTDDGFVFTEPSGCVYFTADDGIDLLDQAAHGPGRTLIVADEGGGSYVAWRDEVTDAGTSSAIVVYDTARQTVAARRDAGKRWVWPQVLDGTDLYFGSESDGGSDYDQIGWNFATGESAPAVDDLSDVADGFYARDDQRRHGDRYWVIERVIVSRDPDAVVPAYPVLEGRLTVSTSDLSPGASYILHLRVDADDTWHHVVVDRAGGAVVTPPVADHGNGDQPLQWIDDDRYVLYRSTDGPDEEEFDLLVCSVSAQRCTVPAAPIPDEALFPANSPD